MGKVARSACSSSFTSKGIPGCSLAQLCGGGPHLVLWWWGQATRHTRHSQLFFKKNLCNEKVAKEPKSSQIKFWRQVLHKRAKFLFFGSKRANLATLDCKPEVIIQPVSSEISDQ